MSATVHPIEHIAHAVSLTVDEEDRDTFKHDIEKIAKKARTETNAMVVENYSRILRKAANDLIRRVERDSWALKIVNDEMHEMR
jgi:biopolymer transport protein ExbB/TolQ